LDDSPAYKPVLDSIGVGELQPELNAMSKQGRWVEMGGLITDDIMNSFAVSPPDRKALSIYLPARCSVFTRSTNWKTFIIGPPYFIAAP
jgi:hypothetical protein